MVFVDPDAAAYLNSDATHLAVGSLGSPLGAGYSRRDLLFGEDLPHRRSDVWQTAHSTRTGPLAPLFLGALVTLAEKRRADANLRGAFFDRHFEIVTHAHGERG